ncbi:hypothetical protein LINPERPRIM_LOCUS35261 [Linum perenne]
MKFIAESKELVVDGVLHIPKEIINLGVKKLQSAIVAQFVGTAPPLKMGIKPIESSTREAPVWITFKKVLSAVVTPEGISWLASQVGYPINKFVRDGLDIKVCVI